MEKYSKKLNNPNLSPKDISSLIPEIESEQKELSVIAESFERASELILPNSLAPGLYCPGLTVSSENQIWKRPQVLTWPKNLYSFSLQNMATIQVRQSSEHRVTCWALSLAYSPNQQPVKKNITFLLQKPHLTNFSNRSHLIKCS